MNEPETTAVGQTVDAPAWLPELQRAFSSALLTPLACDGRKFYVEAASGAVVLSQLRQPSNSDAHKNLPAATLEQRLELYQRQYWMRLFGALQDSFPRVAWHLGHFRFNQVALRHLHTHPPQSADLADLSPAFAAALRREFKAIAESKATATTAALSNPTVSKLLTQALAFDEAELRAVAAHWHEPWQPNAQALALLPSMRLTFAPSFTLLREDWELAQRPKVDVETSPTTATAHDTARYWVCSRTQWSVALQPVEPAFARLLHAAQTQPLDRAVNELQRRLNQAGRDALAQALPAWTTRALQQGWWLGAQPHDATP